jgi:hypothetical protein
MEMENNQKKLGQNRDDNICLVFYVDYYVISAPVPFPLPCTAPNPLHPSTVFSKQKSWSVVPLNSIFISAFQT